MNSQQNKTIFLSAVLKFLSGASIVICYSYTDLKFLSTYPEEHLPYFLFFQAMLLLGISFFLTPMVSRSQLATHSNHRLNGLFFLLMALTLPIVYNLPLSHIYYNSHIFCLWLGAISAFSSVLTYNAINDAFDLRNFKKLNSRLSSVASLGGMILGFAIPFIIRYSSTESLLYILFIFLLAAALVAFLLRSTYYKTYEKNNSQKTAFAYLKQPVLMSVILCAFFLTFVDTFLDYSLKLSLKSTLSKEQIGKFMGNFYGTINLFVFIMQMWGGRFLARYLHINGFLIAVPCFCIFLASITLFMPQLWLLGFLRAGENILRYSLDSSARQLALSPLPLKVRRNSKLILKNILYLGAAISSFCILLLKDYNSIEISLAIVIGVSIVWIVNAQNINVHYTNLLKQCITTKFISPDYQTFLSDSSEKNTLHIVEMSLASGDNESILFALNLLQQSPSNEIPREVIELLYSPHPSIRRKMYEFLGEVYKKDYAKVLHKQLQEEVSPENIWWLIKLLSEVEPESVYHKCKQLLQAEHATTKSAGILGLYLCASMEETISATRALQAMLSSDDFTQRKAGAHLLGILQFAYPQEELRRLLHDPNEQVGMTAIKAIKNRNIQGLIPDLVMILDRGKLGILAREALVSFGSSSSKPIYQEIQKSKQRKKIKSGIKALSLIQDPHCEDLLVQLYKDSTHSLQKEIVSSLSFRAIQNRASEKLLQFANVQLLQEYQLIEKIDIAFEKFSLPQAASTELHIQKKDSMFRLLSWYAVLTASEGVIHVIPAILQNKSQTTRSTGFEFLESVAPTKELSRLLTNLEQGGKHKKNTLSYTDLSKLAIPWLDIFLQENTTERRTTAMDLSQKILILRKVSIFKELSAEILQSIAEVCTIKEMLEGESIIRQGAIPDGMYIIASGEVLILKNDIQVGTLARYDFLGELGLLDDSERKASATANSHCILLFLDKEMFDSITNELPEVLKAIAKKIISYLQELEEKTYRKIPTKDSNKVHSLSEKV
ncbi:MAG: MFS transporter, partial [Spirochaetota bacterium]